MGVEVGSVYWIIGIGGRKVGRYDLPVLRELKRFTELNLLCMGVGSTIAVLSSGAFVGCIWQLPWNTNIFTFIFR